MRIVRAAGWLLEHIGHIYLAALSGIVAVSIGLCLYVALWHGQWGALMILALPGLWLLMAAD